MTLDTNNTTEASVGSGGLAPQQPPVLSLHDSLALGDVELGLWAGENHSDSDQQLEEIHRLPVLLRLLSASRPLSSVPSFLDEPENEDDPASLQTETLDQVANQVVARLEDVAATYSVAEGIDVVACHLAPSVCRNLSKVAPLKRKRESLSAVVKDTACGGGGGGWETNELVVVGSDPRSSFKRRRISQTAPLSSSSSFIKDAHSANNGKAAESADDLHLERCGSVGMLSEGGLSSDDEGRKAAERRQSRRGSEPKDAGRVEDSQEDVVSKTLSDLAALVASSLEPIKLDHNENVDNGGNSNSRKGRLLLTVDDSTLSEPARRHSAADSVRGVMTGSDLGSTIAALMYHAPVLRHQHVANALCRAALPQAADLVKRMGANCPSAVLSLLRGCIDAYKSAVSVTSSRHADIANAAKAAIRALAELSGREKSRVRTVLQQDGILVDVQLQLAISQDQISALCLLLQHLSSSDEIARSEPSLKTLLKENRELLTSTVLFLKNETSLLMEEGGLEQSFGRSCLLFRCCAWLALRCDVMTMPNDSDKKDVEPFPPLVSSLMALGDIIHAMSSVSSRSAEKPLTLWFCASILTYTRLTSMDEPDSSVLEQCIAWVKKCLEFRSSNADYCTMVARIACFLQNNDIKAFSGILQNILDHKASPGSCSLVLSPKLEEGVSKTWEKVKDIISVEALLKDELSSSSPLGASALIDFIRFAESASGDFTKEIKAQLAGLLSGTTQIMALSHEKVPGLIVKATVYLAKHSAINLPVISPLQLESSAPKVDLNGLKKCKLSAEDTNYIFLYQVLYWFAYIDAGAHSLFEFDARALPLKEVLSYSRRLSSKSSVALYLEYLVGKHCPEVMANLGRWELVKHIRIDLTSTQKELDRAAVKRHLSKALKAALSNDATDQSVAIAERAFILARGFLGDADLCTQVVSTLLASPNTPPPFCTYSMLWRDPLVLLKAPMQAWHYGGLRRIVLTLTASLLETNDAILEQASPSDSAADELIAARNLLLVRGLLVAVSGSEEGNSDNTPHSCTMTTHFLRRMIANNLGLVGLLVKQSPALPDSALDWLVEFVPETMDDAASLDRVFSERTSVTARLTAAAAIVRIAVAHGHRDEATTEHLVYAALAQLVSSFFLVVGPVGVPVAVLTDGSGLEITQTAFFGILRSLVNVRGRQRLRLRNECGMALHKLAGLCKGENMLSGVAGAVVSRRKALLREMFEAISKAANAMGCGIDL